MLLHIGHSKNLRQVPNIFDHDKVWGHAEIPRNCKSKSWSFHIFLDILLVQISFPAVTFNNELKLQNRFVAASTWWQPLSPPVQDVEQRYGEKLSHKLVDWLIQLKHFYTLGFS
jgi:hypothetical protein